MRIPRIFADLPLTEGGVVCLPPEASRHVCRVLRLKSGAPLVLFNGRSGEYQASVIHSDPRRVELQVGAFRAVDRESGLTLRLAQGVARGERMDFVIQKAVELGVSRIEPLITEHTVVRLDPERAEKRLTHWRAVAVHACEQCGRNRIPDITPVVMLPEWLTHHDPGGLMLVLNPRSERRLAQTDYAPGPVSLLVGPEGGLSPQELALARAAGFQPVSLGPRTLRTETAAVAALTAIQLRWGDLGG